MHSTLVARMVNEPSSFVVHLGDMVAGTVGRTTNWVAAGDCPGPGPGTGSLKSLIAPLKAKPPPPGLPTSFIAVVGNHDDAWFERAYPDAFGGGYCDVFPEVLQLLPNHTQAPYFAGTFAQPGGGRLSDAGFAAGACSKTDASVYPTYFYYAFTVQRSRFIVLRVDDDNLNLEEGLSQCGAPPYNYDRCYHIHQLDWLRQELTATSANAGIDNIFVVLHAPLLTSSYGHAKNPSSVTLDRLFTQHHVKAVFSGHNHVYERSWPQVFDATSPNGRRDDVNGITFFSSGGGGSGPHGFNGPSPQFPVQSTDPHYLRVEVRGRTATVTAVRANGTVLDRVSW